jgi:hypothetical protein
MCGAFYFIKIHVYCDIDSVKVKVTFEGQKVKHWRENIGSIIMYNENFQGMSP